MTFTVTKANEACSKKESFFQVQQVIVSYVLLCCVHKRYAMIFLCKVWNVCCLLSHSLVLKRATLFSINVICTKTNSRFPIAYLFDLDDYLPLFTTLLFYWVRLFYQFICKEIFCQRWMSPKNKIVFVASLLFSVV